MLTRKRAVEVPVRPRFPGTPAALDGSAAVVAMETAASEAAGAYPITPSTQMGEGWALACAAGATNVNGRKLVFFEPEGEHAAAAVTAGMALVGLRSTNFSSGQGIAYMHESLYAAVGKRLTYVLNMACRAMTKHSLNVHAGHDDYHAVDDTGFFQLFAKDVQSVADLCLVAHRVAELSLNPGICAQDGFLTSHVIETMRLPERELVKEYLGDPSDWIDCPTPAQAAVFGPRRRRIPELFDVDAPAMFGVVQNQDSYAQGVAAQRPFYFDHVAPLTDRAFAEFEALTGRRYARATGHRLEDADVVIAGQGSVVANAEAVADHLRAHRGVKVGVLDVTMFRPFPADLVTQLLRGRRAVVVLERTDQPLAVDPPLLRELRAAMGKAVENGRARAKPLPHPGLAHCFPDEVPEFYSGCFGLGSRDLGPGDLAAAVENALEGGRGRRQFYLGVDFVRRGTRLPKLQIWQERLTESYPGLEDLSLPSVGDLDLFPKGSVSLRMHSVGGWGAITTGKNIALTASELLGLHVKANPKYGSEKKGQPTTFYATLSAEAVKLNCELRHVDVVLAPDPNVFRHSDPLAGLRDGGVFVIQSALRGAELWRTLPGAAQRAVRARKLRVFHLDGFAIAGAEASDPELRYRMQGAAFMGAFFRASPLCRDHGLLEERLFGGIEKQLAKKFGHLGRRVVEDNLRVIRRGYDELVELDAAALAETVEDEGVVPHIPPALASCPPSCPSIASGGRFWEQVGHLYRTGEDGIADPFAALSAIPAATSTMRDMTDVRFEVPDFLPEKCTGCSRCWVQCPDSAIPALVNTVEEVLEAAVRSVDDGRPLDRIRQAVRPLAAETRKLLRGLPPTRIPDVVAQAWASVAPRLASDPERRRELDLQYAAVYAALAEFPLAKTGPFFDGPEAREKNTGGLLSIVVNPETCKGCNVCVEVCESGALVTVKQDEDVAVRMRRNLALWRNLPDTQDRYVNVASLDEGIGVLSSLLLKRENYHSMLGGDGACMGCGEKTAMHLVLSAVSALVRPRVAARVAKIDDLVARLEARARGVVAADADLEAVAAGGTRLELPEGDRATVERIARMVRDLRDLRWRYVEGPTGRGRATAAIANSTGCSSVWASTYPYNPYPFPWVNHLFQDAPSIAVGLFEGHMRKMADGFAAVRRAELELAGGYDAERDEAALGNLSWQEFTDEEFGLCPPILAVGGDGAMLDIGFQNLSRLLASGKPIRVVVLDTQVYSNTGGQACTSGFTGQVSDMAAFGAAQHGKQETRKELALLAIAHRGAYVLQSSQAQPAHLLAGVLRGLQVRRPALFVLHCPCPPEHGIADQMAPHQAKLALESRAFPLLRFDPDSGNSLAERLSLDGNPDLDATWPTYALRHVDAEGREQTLELPLTIADWAATEARFRKHFRPLRGADAEAEGLTPFHEYLLLPAGEREGRTPFLHAIDRERRLARFRVAPEIVTLAEERLGLWAELRQMAGLEVAPAVRAALLGEEERGFRRKLEELEREYAAKLEALRRDYAPLVARRMAEGLLRAGADRKVSDLLAEVPDGAVPPFVLDLGSLAPAQPSAPSAASSAAPSSNGAAAVEAEAAPPAAAPAAAPEEPDGDLAVEPWIESARCTACNECINLNGRLFAYNDRRQAVVKDPRAGTYRELVTAAERCPVAIIHPGTPLHPDERDLAKWVERAKKFA